MPRRRLVITAMMKVRIIRVSPSATNKERLFLLVTYIQITRQNFFGSSNWPRYFRTVFLQRNHVKIILMSQCPFYLCLLNAFHLTFGLQTKADDGANVHVYWVHRLCATFSPRVYVESGRKFHNVISEARAVGGAESEM